MVFVVNGFGFAILSAIFNGCYAVPFKLKRVADLKIQPIVFQLYVSLGVFLSGWCVVPFLQYNDVIARDSSAGKTMCFSLLGALGGALFVVSIAGSFYAIGLLGMTTAQGIWSGVAVVISFMWGVLAFDETPKGSILSAFGVIIIVGGILLVANCRFVAKYFQKPEKSPLFPTEIELRDSTVGVPDLQGSTEQKSDQKAPVSYTLSPAGNVQHSFCFLVLIWLYFEGVMWAIIVGVSASSVLVPLHYTNSAEEGLVYIPSFGIGCIMACPFPVFIFLYNNEWKLPEFHVKQALGFGILSGYHCI